MFLNTDFTDYTDNFSGDVDFPLIPWRVEVLNTDCTDNTDKFLRLGDSCSFPILYLGVEENRRPRLGLVFHDVRSGKMTDKTKYYLLCQWSITPIAHEVLLLSHMQYYSCFFTLLALTVAIVLSTSVQTSPSAEISIILSFNHSNHLIYRVKTERNLWRTFFLAFTSIGIVPLHRSSERNCTLFNSCRAHHKWLCKYQVPYRRWAREW